MEPDTTWGAILWVLFLMGATTIVLIARSTNWFRQWRYPVTPSEKAVREEFAQLMSERLGAALHSAELDKHIVDRWNEWPLEYRPALYQVIRHAQILEETLLEEAFAKGVYPRRIVTSIPEVEPAKAGDTLPPPPLMPTLLSSPSSVNPPYMISQGVRWINGQLMRTEDVATLD